MAEDIVWQRNKLGLRRTNNEIEGLESWMQAHHHAINKLAVALTGEQE